MIELYVRFECPYCVKVIDFAKSTELKEGEDYILIESSKGTPGREKILEVGGQHQVPFLIDGDTSMYESNDIINYLKNKK